MCAATKSTADASRWMADLKVGADALLRRAAALAIRMG
jgi:hypothetical protein